MREDLLNMTETCVHSRTLQFYFYISFQKVIIRSIYECLATSCVCNFIINHTKLTILGVC